MMHRRGRRRRLRLRPGQPCHPRAQFVAEHVELARLHFGIEAHTRIDDSRAQRPLIKIADDRQGAMSAFPPIIAAERHAAIVESDPRTRDELRVHQDEPAVGIVLGGAGFTRHIRANPEA